MAERESATFDLLSIANTSIAKCVDQIYSLLYPDPMILIRDLNVLLMLHLCRFQTNGVVDTIAI